jgi:hypothetical protein
MVLITIYSQYDSLAVYHYRLKGSRLMWRASNFEVWVKGPLNGLLYEQACNLALHHGSLSGVNALDLKRVNRENGGPRKSSFDTKTRRMF